MSATKILFRSFFVLSLPFLLHSVAQGATYEVPAGEGDHLIFKGLAAQVQFIAQPGATQLRVSGLEGTSQSGHYSLFKKDHQIEIRMAEFEGKQEWKKALGNTGAYMHKIEVVGPALPMEVHLHNGSVILQKWNKEAKISLIQGRVSSQGGAGSLQINVQKGDSVVSDHNGKVTVDSYSGTTAIKSIQGDLDIQLFAGNLVLEKIHGFISLNTQQAAGKITQSAGSLQFENGKGALSIQNFQGRIEGQTGEGALSVSFMPESELNLKSKSGRISVQAPANSGALLNLLTVDGDIYVPKELRVNRLSSEKSVRGRLRGEKQKASILIRSQDGSIIVK